MRFLSVLLLYLIISITTCLSCNRNLLDTYDIAVDQPTPTGTNSICPGVRFNCCGAKAHTDILVKWSTQANPIMNTVYTTSEPSLQNMMNAFTEVEQLTAESIPYTRDILNSNCLKMAERIQQVSISKLSTQILDKLKSANAFLMNSRKGFYCSLCDAQSHEFYDEQRMTFKTSAFFCAKMSSAMLPYYLFRYQYLPQVARLYAQWAVSCDVHGNFDSKKDIPARFKLFRQSNILGNLNLCYKGYNKPGAIFACKEFCHRFNPVKFNRNFEGDTLKLDGLSNFLIRRVSKLREKFQHDLERQKERDQEIAGTTKLADKRALSHKASSKAAENQAKPDEIPPVTHLNEGISEISYFNRKFNTGLVTPIEYKFENDLGLRFKSGLFQSIFPLGTETRLNVFNFRNVVAAKGIDYHELGIGAVYDGKAAS